MRIVSIRPEQFEKFASKHKYRSYYQTPEYGLLMSKFDYNIQYIGIINEANILIGASLILYKQVFMNYKVAYAPRGILFNYEKTDQVADLVSNIKKTLGKQGIMLLRIDPYIPLTVRDKDGNIINFNNQSDLIMANLKSAGFNYKGKTKYFEDEKPRWQAITVLGKDIREIFVNFDKRTRHKIRKASNSGVEVFKDENKDIKELYQLIKNKTNKPIGYYNRLIKCYGDKIDVYYSKINTEIFVVNSRRAYEKEMSKNDKMAEAIQNPYLDPTERNNLLNKKMDSDKLLNTYKNNLIVSTELLKKYPDGMIIAGAIVMKYDNAAHIIIDGFNKEYSYLNANYLLRWRMIDDYNKNGYKYLNLNAVVGLFRKQNKYSGLNESKLGFNSIVTEYIGEFDIILNNFAFNLYKNFNKNKKDH
ncbi:MAG: aminoacyltransferase [Firmicutes bacterium]|nr:aminoacyltransferase [Bacillota bacterium]